MIERHVTFVVKDGKEQDFENFFVAAYRPAMSAMPGFISASLLRNKDQKEQFQMVIRFESEAQSANWRNSPQHEALKPGLKALYLENNLKVYEVIA